MGKYRIRKGLSCYSQIPRSFTFLVLILASQAVEKVIVRPVRVLSGYGVDQLGTGLTELSRSLP